MNRYIDAEKLKHILNQSKYYGTKAGRAFADMIVECETADVQKMKCGKWKYDVCTCCGIEAPGFLKKRECDDGYQTTVPLSYYCPNCGAQMQNFKVKK